MGLDERLIEGEQTKRKIPVCPEFHAKLHDFSTGRATVNNYDKGYASNYSLRSGVTSYNTKFDKRDSREKEMSIDSLNPHTASWSWLLKKDEIDESWSEPDSFREESDTSYCSQYAKPNIRIRAIKNKNSFSEFVNQNLWGELCINTTAAKQKSYIMNCHLASDLTLYLLADHYAISSTWWRKWWDYVNVEFFNPVNKQTYNDFEFNKKILISEVLSEFDFGSDIESSARKETLISPYPDIKSLRTQNFSPIKPFLLQMKSEIYNKPSPIWNSEICSFCLESNAFTLKAELTQLYDYVVVNSKAWTYLKHWYGCDFEVKVEKTLNASVAEEASMNEI